MHRYIVCLLLVGLGWTASSEVGADPNEPGIDLDSYRLHSQSSEIPGVSSNASGLTYSAKTRSLFVVIDSPPGIVEFLAGGHKNREIELRGFKDPEGIAHVEDDTFAIVDERIGSIFVCEITAETSVVRRKRCREIPVGDVGTNHGLEGITYSSESKHFFVVKERLPRQIYQVSLSGEVSTPWDAEANSLGLLDLSDVYFDSDTGHLILLSHESMTAVECTIDGEEVSRLSFTMQKAEGLTFDEDRVLYICGEPNFLQEFRRQGADK